MKRLKRFFFPILLLPVLLALPAAAAEADTAQIYGEQLEASGADDLIDTLPEETRRFMEGLGITSLQPDDLTGLAPQNVLESLLGLLGEQAKTPLAACGVVLGIVLLCALMDGARQLAKEPAVSEVFGVICALAACTAVLIPVAGCIRSVSAAAESASVFTTSFVPVYAGVMVTTGQAASALSYQTLMLFAAQLMTMLATYVIVPLMTISLALGLTGAVSGGLKLDAAGGLLNKTAVWLLSLTATLFVGLLSMQNLVGAAAESLAGRAVKFSLSSFVPVVGGALSEALGSVQGCLSLLRSTLGGFGILATAAMLLPPLLECAVWALGLSLCSMASEMFGLTQLTAVLKSAHAVVKTLIGVLAVCGLFLIVSTTIVTMAAARAV